MTKEEDDLKRQMLEDEESDVSEAVSGKISEQSFEEAIAIASPLTRDEQVLINWYMPSGRLLPAIIRDVSAASGFSFSLITQTALVHGFALFSEKHRDVIDLINNLDTAGLGIDGTEYFDRLNYKPIIGKNVSRECVKTDDATSEELNRVSSIINTSRSHLAGCCILLSLCASQVYVSDQAKLRMQEIIATFDVQIELFRIHAVYLIGNTSKQ